MNVLGFQEPIVLTCICYPLFQSELRNRAKEDYLELLLESGELLWPFEQRQVTKDDVQEIEDRLQDDPRLVTGNKTYSTDLL